MGNSISDSIWKTLLTTIVPLCLGTLIFGMMLESYRNELSFRGDIMKDYYTPLVNKQRECIRLGDSLSKDYVSMASNYIVMKEQYHIMMSGQAPRLTSEYKSYLSGLLNDATKFNQESKENINSLAQCKSELYQAYTNVALVTGTISKFRALNDENERLVNEISASASVHADKIRESIKDIDVLKVVNSYFIAGDPGDERNNENDKYTNQLINTKLQPLIDFFFICCQRGG